MNNNMNKRLIFMCGVYVVFQVIVLISSENVSKTSSGGRAMNATINGTKYFISNDYDGQSFMDAMILCNEMGMTLATLDTDEKFDMVYQFLIDNGMQHSMYWIGGVKVIDEYVWLSTGKLATNLKWPNGKPPSPPGDDYCLTIDPTFYDPPQIGDSPSTSSVSCYICEESHYKQ